MRFFYALRLSVNVGVSLSKIITIPASIGSLIPTYSLPIRFMVGTGGTIMAGSSLCSSYILEIIGFLSSRGTKRSKLPTSRTVGDSKQLPD